MERKRTHFSRLWREIRSAETGTQRFAKIKCRFLRLFLSFLSLENQRKAKFSKFGGGGWGWGPESVMGMMNGQRGPWMDHLEIFLGARERLWLECQRRFTAWPFKIPSARERLQIKVRTIFSRCRFHS